MGVILSKLRGKKESSKERLEAIEKELREIQRFQYDTQLQQKRIIGKIWIYSAVIYLLSAVLLYFLAPRGRPWKEQILYILPLIVFPFLMYLVKWATVWYFDNKIVSNREKYGELKKEKERILEDVMDNETYKVAKEILEKHAPSELLPKYLAKQQLSVTPVSGRGASPQASAGYGYQEGMRRRPLSSYGGAITSTPLRGGIRPNYSQSPVTRPGGPGQYLRQPTNAFPYQRPQLSIMGSPATSMHGRGPMSSQSQMPTYMLPQPPTNPTIHNKGSGWFDKIVDYVVGDGATNRYALICRYCATHNGLATQEEFPYTGFRCVFCHQFNPARQIRPTAPKLPVNQVLIEEMEQSVSTTKSDTSTASEDNADENKERRKKSESESDTEGPIVTLEESPLKSSEIVTVESPEKGEYDIIESVSGEPDHESNPIDHLAESGNVNDVLEESTRQSESGLPDYIEIKSTDQAEANLDYNEDAVEVVEGQKLVENASVGPESQSASAELETRE